MFWEGSEHCDGRRGVGVVIGEGQAEVEDASVVGRALGSSEIGMPCQNIFLERSGWDAHCRNIVVLNLLEVSEESAHAVGALLLKNGVTHHIYVSIPALWGHDAHHLDFSSYSNNNNLMSSIWTYIDQ